jgi:fructose-bisphosphate aldolase class I
MYTEIRTVAAAMVASPKGILAADESSPTLTKRFDAHSIESTAESRRDWREMLFSTPGLSNWISGVILYDETFNQSTKSGVRIPEFLSEKGMIPGIKVDTGAKPLAGRPGELVTEGLDGLGPRLEKYYANGARFAKWRAVISIEDGKPSAMCVRANAHALARYAKLCQESGIVPIVEPEVLMEGDHSIDRCFKVTSEVLAAVFHELRLFDIDFPGMVLKPSMVTPGSLADKVSVEEVAEASVRCYKDQVPASVAGIALLSGGQSDQLATDHLAAMNRLRPLPWPITFSYGRALQDAPLKAWKGDPANNNAAQAALAERAQANSAAVAA